MLATITSYRISSKPFSDNQGGNPMVSVKGDCELAQRHTTLPARSVNGYMRIRDTMQAPNYYTGT